MSETVVEKASRRLGIIVFKCLATNPDVIDADGEVVDEASMEEAFYRFMQTRTDEPVDLNHKTTLKGSIVAGWYFPEEHVFRVAFKPEDQSIVDRALAGDFDGSSFYASVEKREDI